MASHENAQMLTRAELLALVEQKLVDVSDQDVSSLKLDSAMACERRLANEWEDERQAALNALDAVLRYYNRQNSKAPPFKLIERSKAAQSRADKAFKRWQRAFKAVSNSFDNMGGAK